MVTDRRDRSRRREPSRAPSVGRAVGQFVFASLVASVVLIVGSVLALRSLARDEAIRDARALTAFAAEGIVEPNLEQGVLTGKPAALRRLERVVQERVLNDRVVRVKIWSRTGRLVYSDEPRLIGRRYQLGEDELEALVSHTTHAELSDLSRPENSFERGQGSLLEVYTQIRAPDGTPLLFELYERFDSIIASGHRVWRAFLPPLVAALLLLWLVQVPLVWSISRRLQQRVAEREELLLSAIESSKLERLRIAAELHDGVIQDLAGVSYSLAAADRAGLESPELVRVLREATTSTRQSVRRLRALLVEINPASLRVAGLEAALTDLVAPLSTAGIQVELTVEQDRELGAEVEALLFRAAGEGIRNVARHAQARNVSLRISADTGNARLMITDDGLGFDPDERARRREEGHVGLDLLEELTARMNGSLEIRARPGGGTTLELTVPTS
ncbi:MAG: two-component sensor histidine kinase [Thermoleophilia bacterium]|nr:two-component sensor histidine kinase [Thermoleophilia bacterium]